MNSLRIFYFLTVPKKTEETITSLKTRVEEISKTYREIMETSLEEVKTARAELKEEIKRQPVTKKETADLLRTNIDGISKDLTGYFREKLADSVSSLYSALKKSRDDMEDLSRKERRGRRFSRVWTYLTPVLLLATCIMSVIGLFV